MVLAAREGGSAALAQTAYGSVHITRQSLDAIRRRLLDMNVVVFHAVFLLSFSNYGSGLMFSFFWQQSPVELITR
jgi:hypothetical protein